MKAAFAAMAAVALLGAGAAGAQDYPSRPVRMVVPFPPGGTTDVVGRLVAAPLSRELGQQFIIDNKGGAGGTIGADAVAKAAPDGYTLLVFHIGMVYGPSLFKSLPYDVVKDFAPVTLLGSAPSALIVPASAPARNVAEFIALAKASPGNLNYGSAGIGTSGHLAAELFQSVAGVKATHVPYKGGGPAVAATISGEVQFMIETAGSIVPHVKGGRLKALGVTSEKRTPALPEVPTIAESGVKDYVYTTWYGLWAPAQTPAPIVNRLSQAVHKVFAQEETRAALAKAGVDTEAATPERFGQIVRKDLETWTKIIRQAGIPAQ